MMLTVKTSQRGDTIIEVLLAMSLLTLILFTSWGLVNRSTQASLASRKRIEMVNQLKEQAEILKTQWANSENQGSAQSITKTLNSPDLGVSSVTLGYDDDFCNIEPSALDAANRFHYNNSAELQRGTKAVNGDSSARVWVEYQQGSGYVDFYIRGCWLTIGGQQKTDNSQFIVRLNS